MKYEMGATLWIMRSNKVNEVKVRGRQITEIEGQPTTHGYQCQYEDGLVRWQWEYELFPNVESLVGSL
jgi:hypothetical protein